MALGVMAARPGELLLHPEVALLARVSSTHPGELVTSPLSYLGVLLSGFRKKLRMTHLPSPLGIFCILDQNIE